MSNRKQNEIMKEILLEQTIPSDCIAAQNGRSANDQIEPPMMDHKNSINGDIKVLKGHLIKEKKEKLILWLQKALIEACYAKLVMANAEMSNCKKNLVQPIAHYYTCKLQF